MHALGDSRQSGVGLRAKEGVAECLVAELGCGCLSGRVRQPGKGGRGNAWASNLWERVGKLSGEGALRQSPQALVKDKLRRRVIRMEMRVLGSPISLAEAKILSEGGIDIIDVKNVNEGSLGASFPWIIQEVVQAFPSRPAQQFSATLGDLPYKPGTAALAALGAAVSGVDYVKAGLYGVRTYQEAKEVMQAVVEACKRYRPTLNAVAAGYADYRRFGGLGLGELVEAAHDAGADLVMVDTAIKDGATLFEALSLEEIASFVRAARDAGMRVALAGSLKLAHLPALQQLQPDIIGVRGALCEQGDRTTGITLERVRAFMHAARKLATATVAAGGNHG